MKHIIKKLYIIIILLISLPLAVVSVFWAVMYWSFVPIDNYIEYIDKMVDNQNLL